MSGVGVDGCGGLRVESLGARFKRERERQGITLDDVAVSTKIGTRMLQALEDEHYDRLPGGIFNKGIVRAYARHLGLDEEQAIADYVAATAQPPVGSQPAAVMEALAAHAVETRGERLGALDRIPWGKLAVLLLVVAIVLTIWGPRPQPSEKRKPESVPQSGQPAADPAPVPRSEDGTARTAIPAAVVASDSAPSGQAPAAGGFSLRIQAKQDSWLSITADGKPIPQAVLPAGSEKSIEANREIVVKAGNVGGLDFWFNGNKLAPQGKLDQAKTLTFAPLGLQPRAAKTAQPAISP
jgi:cytoskeleton protein RodZ